MVGFAFISQQKKKRLKYLKYSKYLSQPLSSKFGVRVKFSLSMDWLGIAAAVAVAVNIVGQTYLRKRGKSTFH